MVRVCIGKHGRTDPSYAVFPEARSSSRSGSTEASWKTDLNSRTAFMYSIKVNYKQSPGKSRNVKELFGAANANVNLHKKLRETLSTDFGALRRDANG